MALSGYEKQKRWREKNRALYNFQQRQRRKNLGVGSAGVVQNQERGKEHPETVGVMTGSPVQPKSKIEELRELVRMEQEKPAVEAPAKLQVYRNDYGAIISEAQWDRLQKLKERAKNGGYEIDQWSQ